MGYVSGVIFYHERYGLSFKKGRCIQKNACTDGSIAMKAKGKKITITVLSLTLIALATYAVTLLGAGAFWSTLISGLAGTIGSYIMNNA